MAGGPGTLGAEKSRRARLGVGGMRDGQIAVGPLGPRSHAFLTAPLAPPRSLVPSLPHLPSLYLSLFLSPPSPPLSLSRSVSLTFCPPCSCKIPSHEHAALAPRLYALGIHLVPLLSLPRLVYVLHIRMTHIYHKRKFLLSFSLSLALFFFLFQIPFCAVSRTGTRTHEFAGLSLSFSPFLHAIPFRFQILHLARLRVRIHVHARSSLSRVQISA